MRLNTKLLKTQLSTLILFCSLVATGCASTKPVHVWTDSALEAQDLHSRGELAEAQERYVKLTETAPNEESRRWMLLSRAELALEEGRRDEARDLFVELHEAGIEDLYGANAALALARMEPEGSKDEAYLEVIRGYPAEVAPERALELLEQRFRGRDALPRFVELTTALHADVSGSFVGDNILFVRAQIEEELGRSDDALDTYRELFDTYSDGPLADDALWEMARIYREAQQWDDAIPILERIATDVEESWFVGSYASEWVNDSILKLAEIHLLHLDDYDEAIRWYDYYVEQYPHGFESDDAAWAAVEARRIAGDENEHFEAMRRFVERFPRSKWTHVARARLGIRGGDDTD